MIEKLEALAARFHELTRLLSEPEVVRNQERLKKTAREHAELRELMRAYELFQRTTAAIAETEELSQGEDPEMAELAREELKTLREQSKEIEESIKLLLVPPDPLEKKNVILELRAGTGGEEATLFARELFEMYRRFAENKGWRTEVLSLSPSEQGGFKEVIALISGREVYRSLQFESGVHRVQRVPVTESQGRIHTSAVTVAVLPEAEEVDIEIREDELKIDVFRAQGAGGQHVNTTDSAVRITHLPTGTVVVCQDERSQHKNKARAMKILRSRLLEMEREKQHEERAALRKSMVRTGDRSEKIRTYNFPQNRITDHRVNLTLHKLGKIMEGDLDEIVETLTTYYAAQKLSVEDSASTS